MKEDIRLFINAIFRSSGLGKFVSDMKKVQTATGKAVTPIAPAPKKTEKLVTGEKETRVKKLQDIMNKNIKSETQYQKRAEKSAKIIDKQTTSIEKNKMARESLYETLLNNVLASEGETEAIKHLNDRQKIQKELMQIKKKQYEEMQQRLRRATWAELLLGKVQGAKLEMSRRLTIRSAQLAKANWSLVSVQMSLLGVFFSTLMLGMYLTRMYTALVGPLSDLETAIKNTAFAYGLADKMGVDVEGTFGKLDDQVDKTQEGFLRVKFASSFASLALQDVAASVFSNNEIWAKFKDIMAAWKDVAPDVKEAAKELFKTILDLVLQLIPHLPGILDFLRNLLEFIKPITPYLAKAMLFAMTFMAILAPIAAGLGGVAFAVKAVAVIIGVLGASTLGWIAVAAAAVVAIGYLLHKLGVLKDVIALVVDWFKTLKDWILLMPPGLHTLGFAITHLTDLWNILKTALENVWNWLGNVKSAISMLTAPLSDLADKLRGIKDLSSFVGGAISGLGTTTVTKPIATTTVTTPIQQSNVITNNIYTPADKDEITDSILKTLFDVGGMLGL